MFPTGELVFRSADSTINGLSEGLYGKNMLVLALAEADSAANKLFLAKVLSAANLNLDSDALFSEVPVGEPINCFVGLPARPKFILVFGLSPAQVGLQAAIQPYQVAHLHQVTWLFADAVSQLEPDREKKGKLWSVLKEIFL
jgi:hypothetical protein